jgi:hypothetical protein
MCVCDTSSMPGSRITLVVVNKNFARRQGQSVLCLNALVPNIRVPIMQCDAQNAEYQVEVVVTCGLLMQPSFTFLSPAQSTGHLICVPEG